MSEFEHLARVIQLHVGNATSTTASVGEFITHGFSLLDAWWGRASEQDKDRAFAFTQSEAFQHPYLSAWWFAHEQKDPARWTNTWSGEDFKQQVVRTRTNYWGAEHFLARMDWAMRHQDWGFFESWDLKVVPRLIKKLCAVCGNDPTIARLTGAWQQHNPELFNVVYNDLPPAYIQQHHQIISGGSSLLVQHSISEALKSKNLQTVADVLKSLTHTALAPVQPKFIEDLQQFWAFYERASQTATEDTIAQLKDISTQFTTLFPHCIEKVVPRLLLDSSPWVVEANMLNTNRIQWYACTKTAQMINAVFVFPSIQPWVEFWTETKAIEGWTDEHTAAGNKLYTLDTSAVAWNTVKIDRIERQMAAHWTFFEHEAPRMGRALAAVVAFLGGHPPQQLCDFSNLFDFTFPGRHFPPGFKDFIEAHVQRTTLAAELDPHGAPLSTRKM